MFVHRDSLAQGISCASRVWLRTLAGLLVCLLPAAPAFAAADYEVAPAPAWVLATQPGEATPAHLKQATEGVSYLLVDNQVLSAGSDRVRYFRYVSRALNAKGVESVANLSIDFDPAWQTVQLHSVRVLRGGKAIDKLRGARVEVIRQEKELDELILNGSKTLKLFLEDVRPGDVVDYAFSTSGRNPVFAGREFGAFDLQWGVPVARLHARLLVPAGTVLDVRTRNSALKPQQAQRDGLREYRWQVEHTTPLTVEVGAPEWYAPFAEAEWSGFRDWAAVAQWAQPLYRVPARLGPALEAEAKQIARAEPTPVGRMLAVLRFVQREVRYLGVETGRNTHVPNPPDLVFARRFGDCKDKVLLTLSLMRRLGIEAYPALVNTESRRGIAARLPNPAAFDHVIVQVRIGAQHWWLDPTRAMQESDAEHLYQPDFGLALVVAPQARGLQSMGGQGARSRREVHMVFDARKQFSAPVGFRVVTVYEGGAAESQREELAGASMDSVQQDYLRYYAESYPGIRVVAPIRVADDKTRNRLTTTEEYAIADFAGKADRDGKRTAWIESPDVDELLGDPEVKLRKSPLQLKYPLEVKATTEVLLPETWTITDSDTRVDDPVFSFRRRVQGDSGHRRILIHDEFRSLADEIAAREMPRYTANLAKARGELDYSLSWNDALPPPVRAGAALAGLGDRLNWPLLLLSGFALFVFARLAGRAWRYDPAPTGVVDSALAGLRGWLWLYSIGVVVTPLAFAGRLWLGADAWGNIAWSRATGFGGADYHPLHAPALLFELLGSLALLVASLQLVRLYFARRSSYPRLAVAFYVLAFGYYAGDLLFAAALPGESPQREELAQLVRFALSASLWGAYLLTSRRVRSTFVCRLRVHAPPPVPSMEALAGISRPAPGQPELLVEPA